MAKFLLPLAAALSVIFWMAHLTFAAVIAGLATAYFVSLYAHPNRDCVSCHGHKSHGAEGSSNFRRCWTCKGRGHYPRWGVILLRRDVIKGIKAGRRGEELVVASLAGIEDAAEQVRTVIPRGWMLKTDGY